MSFRSGGPGHGRNEVWTDEKGRVYSSKRDEGGSGVCRFGFCPNLHTFRGGLISTARKIGRPFFAFTPRIASDSDQPHSDTRYKYTKDVIGHRRSLCGLASQGSHYPYPNPFRGSNPFWSVLLLQITLDLLLHRPRKSLIDPAEKRWAPKRSSSARRRKPSFRVLEKIRCNLSAAFPELYLVITLTHYTIFHVNASGNML